MAKQSNYQEYTVKGYPLAGQTPRTCYYWSGDEALYDITDQLSDGYVWELVQSLRNDTSVQDMMKVEYRTELKVTKGKELETHWNIGAAYEGLSVGIGGSEKTFESTETTDSKTHSYEVPVPAKTTVYFYQKVYRFKTHMWFINWAWGERSRVGGYGNYSPAHVDGYVLIRSHEHWASQQEAKGSTSTWVDEARDDEQFKWTRMFENCTSQCRDYLEDRRATIPG